MTPAHRSFNERMIARLAPIAAARAAEDGVGQTIAGALREVIQRLADEMSRTPPPAAAEPSPRRFMDIFSLNFRDRMLASADVCREIGEETAARAFEQRAQEAEDPGRVAQEAFRTKLREAAAAIADLPIAAAPAFAAGPQMSLFE